MVQNVAFIDSRWKYVKIIQDDNHSNFYGCNACDAKFVQTDNNNDIYL